MTPLLYRARALHRSGQRDLGRRQGPGASQDSETEPCCGQPVQHQRQHSDLGARVLPVGVVGDDAAGRVLLEYFRRKGVSVDINGQQTIDQVHQEILEKLQEHGIG